MKKYLLFALSVGCLVLCMLGVCSEYRPTPSDVTVEQIRVIESQFDALHEQVASVDAAGTWLLIVLGACILAPIILAVVLLVQADRMALHNDEILRQLDQHGVTSEIIDTGKLLGERSTVRASQCFCRRHFQRIRMYLRLAGRKAGERNASEDSKDNVKC